MQKGRFCRRPRQPGCRCKSQEDGRRPIGTNFGRVTEDAREGEAKRSADRRAMEEICEAHSAFASKDIPHVKSESDETAGHRRAVERAASNIPAAGSDRCAAACGESRRGERRTGQHHRVIRARAEVLGCTVGDDACSEKRAAEVEDAIGVFHCVAWCKNFSNRELAKVKECRFTRRRGDSEDG